MKSPCILVCQLDHKTGFCFGCGRTGNEIMRWTGYSEAERDAIMAGLDARLVQLGMKPGQARDAHKPAAEALARKQLLE